MGATAVDKLQGMKSEVGQTAKRINAADQYPLHFASFKQA
jgi:hypothetical protein